MDSARITFVQTGGAPDKANCKVRWSVNGEKYKISVQHNRKDNNWGQVGDLRVDDIEFIGRNFNEEDRWVMLRYRDSGKVYQLVAEGPEETNGRYYYHAKIEMKLPNGEFKTIDDSLLEDIPEMSVHTQN